MEIKKISPLLLLKEKVRNKVLQVKPYPVYTLQHRDKDFHIVSKFKLKSQGQETSSEYF